jgi:hypothetical protein
MSMFRSPSAIRTGSRHFTRYPLPAPLSRIQSAVGDDLTIGRIAIDMAHQGFDLQLTRYDERGWRATFYTTGMEHSPTSATGTGWERTPWRATQCAAWEALKKAARWARRRAFRDPTSGNIGRAT